MAGPGVAAVVGSRRTGPYGGMPRAASSFEVAAVAPSALPARGATDPGVDMTGLFAKPLAAAL
ncbi:hypothetical protein JCM10599A_27020 [Paraburkholderia kururiensis]